MACVWSWTLETDLWRKPNICSVGHCHWSYRNAQNATEKALDGESFANDKFSLAAVLVGNDKYLGRTCTGRIYSGSVTMHDELVKAILLEMNESSADGKTRLKFEIPSRGLLGFSSEVATVTPGSAVVNHVFIEDCLYAGALDSGIERGKLVSSESGKATTYALSSLAAQGILFVGPGDVVYPGMVIGESAKAGD